MKLSISLSFHSYSSTYTLLVDSILALERPHLHPPAFKTLPLLPISSCRPPLIFQTVIPVHFFEFWPPIRSKIPCPIPCMLRMPLRFRCTLIRVSLPLSLGAQILRFNRTQSDIIAYFRSLGLLHLSDYAAGLFHGQPTFWTSNSLPPAACGLEPGFSLEFRRLFAFHSHSYWVLVSCDLIAPSARLWHIFGLLGSLHCLTTLQGYSTATRHSGLCFPGPGAAQFHIASIFMHIVHFSTVHSLHLRISCA
ncbi:unnamed protein product, partial [Mycena citricolor]